MTQKEIPLPDELDPVYASCDCIKDNPPMVRLYLGIDERYMSGNCLRCGKQIVQRREIK